MSTLLNFNPVQCSQTFARWLQPMDCNCILHLHSLPMTCFQLQPPNVYSYFIKSSCAAISLHASCPASHCLQPDRHLGVKLFLRHIMPSWRILVTSGLKPGLSSAILVLGTIQKSLPACCSCVLHFCPSTHQAGLVGDLRQLDLAGAACWGARDNFHKASNRLEFFWFTWEIWSNFLLKKLLLNDGNWCFARWLFYIHELRTDLNCWSPWRWGTAACHRTCSPTGERAKERLRSPVLQTSASLQALWQQLWIEEKKISSFHQNCWPNLEILTLCVSWLLTVNQIVQWKSDTQYPKCDEGRKS